MKPRTIITLTLLACLLVSAPVWAQGQQPVCPCWDAEELEAAVSAFCLESVEQRCGVHAPPGLDHVVAVECLVEVEEGFLAFFTARTSSPLGAPDAPSACEFHAGEVHTGEAITPAEAAACRADVLRVCPQLNP